MKQFIDPCSINNKETPLNQLLPQGDQDMLKAVYECMAQANDINNEVIEREMKTQHIKKLRTRVQNFREYTVSTTYGLFGDFGTEGMWVSKILADSPQVAVQRYLSRYWRTYKEKHPKMNGTPIECSRRYGKIMVIDNKGYHYFFN